MLEHSSDFGTESNRSQRQHCGGTEPGATALIPGAPIITATYSCGRAPKGWTCCDELKLPNSLPESFPLPRSNARATRKR